MIIAKASLFAAMKLFALAFLVACNGTVTPQIEPVSQSAPIRYVAIGDSYSIGEGASPNESWPALLTRDLRQSGIKIDLVANPSRTGWPTQHAIDRELPIFEHSHPTFATLQIGVNDWVQGIGAEEFRQRFAIVVARMLEMLPDKKKLLVVNIPDFGVTPTGAQYRRGRNISEGISRFNEIIAEESARRGVGVVDVFQLSQRMATDPSLIAPDGLHPSAKEYAQWEEAIAPIALKLLRRDSQVR